MTWFSTVLTLGSTLGFKAALLLLVLIPSVCEASGHEEEQAHFFAHIASASSFQEGALLFNEKRFARIVEAFSSCEGQLPGRFAIFALGSVATRMALPCSDFEFGVVGDAEFLSHPASLDKLLTAVKRSLKEQGIVFDKKGWTPPVQGQGSSQLIGTPDQFIALLRADRHSTLRYTLHMTRFVYGDPTLYRELCEKRDGLERSKRLFAYEYDRTRRRMGDVVPKMKEIEKRLTGATPTRSHPLNYKPHLLKPVIELIHYLSYAHLGYLDNTYCEIEKLVAEKAIDAPFGTALKEVVSFGLSERVLTWDEDVFIAELDVEHLYNLKKSWDTAVLLNSHVFHAYYR